MGCILTPYHSLLEDSKIKVLIGGQHDVAQRYIAPTVVKAELDAKIMQSEIFGPILPIIVLPTVNDIIAYVNAHEKPLALYIFTDDTKEQELILGNTSSGGVTVNDVIMHCGNLEYVLKHEWCNC